MWVKLIDGTLEWITGFKVVDSVLWGRLNNSAWIVLHTYATEDGAQEGLAGIRALAGTTGPMVEIQEPEEESEETCRKTE